MGNGAGSRQTANRNLVSTVRPLQSAGTRLLSQTCRLAGSRSIRESTAITLASCGFQWRGQTMIRDCLLALGLVLANATQLRLPGLPLGVGEFFLVAWLALTLAHEVHRLGPPLNTALSRLIIFWLVFAFAQSVGWMVGLATEHFPDTASAAHTAIAYMLVAAVSCFIVVMPESWRRLRRITWIAVVVGATSVAVLLAGAYDLVPLPGIEPWIWRRLRGWSENPNQFALLCAALLVLSVHLTETAEKGIDKLVALACAVPFFIAGILTKSDSFILFVLIAAPMFLCLKLWIWVFSIEPRLTFRTAFASLMFLASPALLVSAAPFAPAMIDRTEEFAAATMEQNDQAENRFKLWREALVIGMEANMLGLGPGPHLVKKQWKRPPPDKFEAHNTLLDLFTQGGIVASLSFLWITATAFVVAYRAKRIALAMLVLSVFIFSNFHFIARHPIYWFSIALCLVAGEGVRRRPP